MHTRWPLAVSGARKNDIRTQFAALCYRKKAGKLQVLIITSRRTGRWIVPKGWPVPEQSPTEAVATEAWEEAGVKGEVFSQPIGIFSYVKEIDDAPDLPCVALVYPLKAQKVERDYPERAERKRMWVSRKKAAEMVDSQELARLIKSFDPRLMH